MCFARIFSFCSGLIAALSVLSFSSACAAPEALTEPTTSVKWICPPETFRDGTGKVRYYRRAFSVKPGLRRALLRWWLDDGGELYLDGSPVSGRKNSRIADALDVTEALCAPVLHCLAAHNVNLAGKGGICVALSLEYADGSSENVKTDCDWRCAFDKAEGWTDAAFADADWPRAKEHDDIAAGPWSARADMTLLLPPDERAQIDRFRKERDERFAAVMKRLEKESKPVCKVVYDRGKSFFDIGGKRFETAFYNASESWHDDNRKLRRQTAYFRDAGVHLFGLGIDFRQAWLPDGSVDVSFGEAAMRSALAIDPEARFLFCLSAVLPPKWWAEKNPGELVGYLGAQPDVNQPACLKNCAAPSAASRVWRRDFSDALRRAVEQLERGPFAKRIFAYRVDWGINHEWHYYGMRGLMPDNGAAMTAAFREWLRRSYGGSLEALRAAWGESDVTFETAAPPSAELRLRKSAGRFRDPVRERPVIDYERCHAQLLRTLLLHANRTVKETCANRALVGNYCGYYFGVPETAEGWHLENDALLDSPYVDFQCSPPVYGAESRMRGRVQHARCLLEGLRRRGKVALLEADNSTTVAETPYCRYSDSTQSDIALLARDFAQALCWGCGYWYFDFGQGWYADQAFGDFFRKIYPLRRADADCSSVSEVLVVGDYESVTYTHAEYPPTKENLAPTDLVNAIGRTGAPFDSASFADLASGALKDYKVYVFPNLHYATQEKEAVIARLRKRGARLVWIGEPGILRPEGVGVALSRSPDTVYPAVPSYGTLRSLLRECGVHVYCDHPESVVYANASYVAVHNARPGRIAVSLPQASRVTEVYPGSRPAAPSAVTSFAFSVDACATTIFRLDPPK